MNDKKNQDRWIKKRQLIRIEFLHYFHIMITSSSSTCTKVEIKKPQVKLLNLHKDSDKLDMFLGYIDVKS